MALGTHGEPTPLDTVVLAGSVNRIALYPGNRPGRKALVRLRGRSLLEYVLESLAGARAPGRIIVVGGPEVLAAARAWSERRAGPGPEVPGVPEGRTLVENAWRGLRAARTERVLFCHPDQPLLRPKMVDDFVERALPLDADMVTSWVRHEHLGEYVEADHKFADFGDGRYAHGNLFMVRRNFPDARRVRQRLDRLYRARKSLIRFAWALGPSLFFSYVLARVTGKIPSLDETLARAGDYFGLTLAAVRSPHPEIVLDVDEPEDYAAALRHLERRSAPGPLPGSACAAQSA